MFRLFKINILPLLFIPLFCFSLFASSGVPYLDPGTSTPTANRVVKFDSAGKLPVSAMDGSITASQLSSNLSLNGTTSGIFNGTHTGNGSLLTGITASVAFPAVTGSASASQLPNPLQFAGTTTLPITDSSDFVLYNNLSVGTDVGTDTATMAQPTQEYGTTAATKLLLLCNNAGTSTFTDSSTFHHSITTFGSAIGSSTARFGSGSAWFNGAANNYLRIGTSSVFAFGTESFRFDASVWFNSILGFNIIYANRSTDKFVFDYKQVTSELRAQIGASIAVVTWNPSTKTWYDLSIIRYMGSVSFFINGSQTGASQTVNDSISAEISPYVGGDPVDNRWFDGLIDNLRLGSDSVNLSPDTNYDIYDFIFLAPNTGDKMLQLQPSGTYTGKKSYIFANATTTVFGGTSSAAIATSTTCLIYGVPGKGGAAFDFLSVHSVEAIKSRVTSLIGSESEHLEKVLGMSPKSWHPKIRDVYILDVEAEAKKNYIQENYSAWIKTNKLKYVIDSKITATGTVYLLDENTATRDYNSEIEIAWASDLEKPNLIREAQEKMESDPNITRLGFLVHDESTPVDIKGADGDTIDLMSLMTLMRNAIKAQQDEIDVLRALVNP